MRGRTTYEGTPPGVTTNEPGIRERLIQAESADAIGAIFTKAFASKQVVRTRRGMVPEA